MGISPARLTSAPFLKPLTKKPSPHPLLPAKPPHQPNRRRILLPAAAQESVGLEIRLVGKIVPPFVAHHEAFRDLVIQGGCRLFQRLAHAAEHALAIGQILRAYSHRHPRHPLIERIRRSTPNLRWC